MACLQYFSVWGIVRGEEKEENEEWGMQCSFYEKELAMSVAKELTRRGRGPLQVRDSSVEYGSSVETRSNACVIETFVTY